MPNHDYVLESGPALEKGPAAVLLIHGLTGTPLEMRPVAKGLHRAGFHVRAVQLAGHCGTEADLLRTRWPDWYASVSKALDELRSRFETVFVGGLSMGALLALKLAAERPRDVRGVAAYGATFAYDGWAIPRIARLACLLPAVTGLGLGRGRSFMELPPYGIKDARIRQHITASMFAGDSGAAGLPGNPWPSLAELYKLSARVRRQLADVSSPCLVVHATEDDIASPRNAQLVERGVSGPVETLWLRDSYHMVTLDRERQAVAERSAQFFTRFT